MSLLSLTNNIASTVTLSFKSTIDIIIELATAIDRRPIDNKIIFFHHLQLKNKGYTIIPIYFNLVSIVNASYHKNLDYLSSDLEKFIDCISVNQL